MQNETEVILQTAEAAFFIYNESRRSGAVDIHKIPQKSINRFKKQTEMQVICIDIK